MVFELTNNNVYTILLHKTKLAAGIKKIKINKTVVFNNSYYYSFKILTISCLLNLKKLAKARN